MISAFGMVILPQNLGTGNGKIPCCSCIISVGYEYHIVRITCDPRPPPCRIEHVRVDFSLFFVFRSLFVASLPSDHVAR